MNRIAVVVAFAAVCGIALWLSAFPRGDTPAPRRAEPVREAPRDEGRRAAAPEPGQAPHVGAATAPTQEAATGADPGDETVAGGSFAAPGDGPVAAPTEAERVAAEARNRAERERREVERRLLEARAAEIALAMGLVTPQDIETQVERAVPEGSVPDEDLEIERGKVREEKMADQAIAKCLADRKLGAGAPAAEVRRVSDFGLTLLSAEDDAVRDRLLQVVVEAGPGGC